MELDNNYTFDTFVSETSNNLLKTICTTVAENLGRFRNPLFIYSERGLGKTHLLNAIGNYVTSNSDKKVLYITSQKFADDFLNLYLQDDIQAIEEYKRKYYDADVLLMDDIQYLEAMPKVQKEFYDIFNSLYIQHKQIVITSDRVPMSLIQMNENLKSRFTWGVVVGIEAPDINTRKTILDKMIEKQKFQCFIPNEVRMYIASSFTDNIKKMEGALIRVIAYASMTHKIEITLELAKEALKDYVTIPKEGPYEEIDFYDFMNTMETRETETKDSINILYRFEQELGRNLSSLELELIDAIDTGIASRPYLDNILQELKRKEIKYE